MFAGTNSSGTVGRPVASVENVMKRERRSWWLAYATSIAITVVIATIAARTFPTPFSFAFVLFVGLMVLSILRPAVALYSVVFFAVLGDFQTSPWYPFTTTLSSRQSILFISNGLSFYPLELCLIAMVFGWILQMAAQRSWVLHKGPLFRPLLVFTAFMLFGFVHGMASGGDRTAGLWELRWVMILPVLYLLLTNLFERRDQYVRLWAFVMVAVFINGIIALLNYQSLTEADREGMESFISHGATLSMNAMLILLLGVWMFRKSSWAWRACLPFALVPVTFMYLLSQRRAAFVALIAGLGVVAIVLLWTKRRVFWKLVPVVLVIGAVYCAAFWHDETGTAGFPAQAVKSVIAPDEVSERNRGSDLYRIIEKQDIQATIRSSPIVGIGFGRPFLRPYPLPQIAPFLLEPYMPHNAILWVWMKAGIGGFIAMLYLFGKTMYSGARAILRAGRSDYAATLLTAVAFVIMYCVFAYVDIAWDPQNMVLLALAIAHIGSAARLEPEEAAEPVSGLELTTAYTKMQSPRVRVFTGGH
jgi:O-antigen ligase